MPLHQQLYLAEIPIQGQPLVHVPRGSTPIARRCLGHVALVVVDLQMPKNIVLRDARVADASRGAPPEVRNVRHQRMLPGPHEGGGGHLPLAVPDGGNADRLDKRLVPPGKE